METSYEKMVFDVDIIGKEIIHANKLFGEGTITSFNSKILCAYFPLKGKECKLSIEPACIKLYFFPDISVAQYLNTISQENEVQKRLTTSKSKLQEEYITTYEFLKPICHISSNDWSTHNIIKNGILQPIIVCASTRSLCVHKDFTYENRKHNVEMRNMIVGCLDRDGYANIGAEHCFDCDEYKIDRYSIYYYEDRYGKLILLRQKENHGNGGHVSTASMCWDPATKLKQLGYTTKQAGGYTERQRHRLLSYIVDNNLLPLSEVMGTIRQARNMSLDMNYTRNILANKKRQIDLDFLEEKYMRDEEARISVLQQSIK